MKRFWLCLSVAALSAGCGAADSPCDAAKARLGYRLCVEKVDSTKTWVGLAQPLTTANFPRTGNYLVPAKTNARLPTVFQDGAAALKSHYEFLAQGFPDLFPGLTPAESDALTTDPQGGEFFSGSMNEYVKADGSTIYGYRVWDKQTATGSVSCDQMKAVHAALGKAFAPTPLAILPTTSFQRDALNGCGVPSWDPPAN